MKIEQSNFVHPTDDFRLQAPDQNHRMPKEGRKRQEQKNFVFREFNPTLPSIDRSICDLVFLGYRLPPPLRLSLTLTPYRP